MQLPAGFRIVRQATAADQAVWELVAEIPAGRVASYGRLAEWLGWQRSARIVGRAMAHSHDGLPAHRVVAVNGRLVPGWEREQAQRLRAEGVMVAAGHVRPPIPWWEGPRRSGARHVPGTGLQTPAVRRGTRPARSSG